MARRMAKKRVLAARIGSPVPEDAIDEALGEPAAVPLAAGVGSGRIIIAPDILTSGAHHVQSIPSEPDAACDERSRGRNAR